MTLVISWIGVDQKKNGPSVASIYIASDSRYTWDKLGKFDYGIKVFGCATKPEIFGFCGDVLFPSIVLHQLIPQIDNGLLFGELDDGAQKNLKIFSYVSTSLKLYPAQFIGKTFTILHATRTGKTFQLYTIKYLNGHLENNPVPLRDYSTTVFSDGTGRAEFEDNWKAWEDNRHNNYRTSRAVYHCLDKTLKEIKDFQTGGLPQVVGLYREGNYRLFGIVDNLKKYIFGKESSEDIASNRIEWRNENFERIDPIRLKLIEGAQRQPI